MRSGIILIIVLAIGCTKEEPIDTFVGNYNCRDTTFTTIVSFGVPKTDTVATTKFNKVQKVSELKYSIAITDSKFQQSISSLEVSYSKGKFYVDTISPFSLQGTHTDSSYRYTESPIVGQTYNKHHTCTCQKNN